MLPGKPAMFEVVGRIALLLAAALPLLQDPPVAKPPVRIFDEAADPVQDIAAAGTRAAAGNRRVLVVWGANWCAWCRTLDALPASDPKVRRELLYEYEIVHADIGRLDKNLELAAGYGADISRGAGIPYLTILDAEGKVLGSSSSAPLERKGRGPPAYDSAKVLALLARFHAPRPLAEDVFAAAVARAKSGPKPLFLSFGALDSEGSVALQGWLESELVAPLLTRDFAVVRIDAVRTDGCEELLGCLRSDGASSLPWFAVLDRDGQVVATSQAADGKNIRFPPNEDGIEHIQAVLRRTAKGISEADLVLLGSTLADLGGATVENAPAAKTPAEEKPKPADDPPTGG